MIIFKYIFIVFHFVIYIHYDCITNARTHSYLTQNVHCIFKLSLIFEDIGAKEVIIIIKMANKTLLL